MKAASELVRYYESVSIELTETKISWPVIENYEIQQKAIYLRIKQTVPDVLKIGKTTTVAKCNDSRMVYAGQVFGVRKSSLKYVIRYNGEVVMPHPTLVLNRPYSTLVGLVAGAQALRLSHTRPLFRDDNEQFYGILEEAVRRTVYEATIKPFQRLVDGCGSYLALIAPHTWQDKWIAILRTAK